MIKRVVFDEFGNPTEIEFSEGVSPEYVAYAWAEIRSEAKHLRKLQSSVVESIKEGDDNA